MKVELLLIEEMLGTKAADPEVFATYIASQHPSGTPQRDELDQPENKEVTGTSVFHQHEGRRGIYDYQVKGFFKDAAGALNRFDKKLRNNLEKLAAFKTKIDGCIFVSPRFIPLRFPPGGVFGVCERPMRVETAQGPRVCLARSETAPIGTVIACEIEILSGELEPYVEAWLNYGKRRGIGQWRNSGKGSFSWTEVK